MSLIHFDFESEFTGHNEDVYIVMPDKKRGMTPVEFYGNGKKYPVLWLLHGTFGGYSDWIRKSNIEVYACEHECIVVMMGVGNADYEAWPAFTLGYDSTRYVVDELMPIIYNWLPASDKREDNFIAGLSMGGGGTMKFALNYPEKFAAAAVLSSCPQDMDGQKADLEALFAKKPSEVTGWELRRYNQMHRYDSVSEYLDSISNTWRKLDELVAEKADLPRFMFAIGTEDGGYANMQKFRKHADEIGLPYEYHEGPGRHEWRVWERDIQIAFRFFGFGEEEQGNIF